MTRALLFLIGVLAVTSAQAQTSETVEARVAEALASAVRARMGSDADVSIANLQVALRPGVAGSLAVTIAPNARLGAAIEFGVVGRSTAGRGAWVGRGRADVTVSVRHVVAARTLARGTVLTADDVVEVTGEPGAVLMQHLPTREAVSGATLRRDAGDGEVVTALNIVLPPAVRAGDMVQAQASIGPVQVIGELMVMESGAEGAIVRGVNRESKREVRVRVLRAGVVEVLHE